MTTHPSQPSIPAGGTQHVIHESTTPKDRLVVALLAVGGLTLVTWGFDIEGLLYVVGSVVGAMMGFLLQYGVFRDPDTVERLAGIWAPIAEVVVRARTTTKKYPVLKLIPRALLYGGFVTGAQFGVRYLLDFVTSWQIAAGLGLILLALIYGETYLRELVNRLNSRGPRPVSDDEDDELLALPPPAKPSRARKVATRVRLTLPAAEVEASKLEKALTARGMSDVERFVTEFNARTTDREGTVRTVVSIYDDGTHSFTVADEED